MWEKIVATLNKYNLPKFRVGERWVPDHVEILGFKHYYTAISSVAIVRLQYLTQEELLRDGPLEKWWGGGGGEWGKSQKKIHARENAKKKNSCKEEVKQKKFMQKEGPIVIFIQYIKSANKHVKMELTGNSQIYWMEGFLLIILSH